MKRILNAVMQRLKEQVTDLRYIAEDWGAVGLLQRRSPGKIPLRPGEREQRQIRVTDNGEAVCVDDDPDPCGGCPFGLWHDGRPGSLPRTGVRHFRRDG